MRVGIFGSGLMGGPKSGPKTCQESIRLSTTEIHSREPAGEAQIPRSPLRRRPSVPR